MWLGYLGTCDILNLGTTNTWANDRPSPSAFNSQRTKGTHVTIEESDKAPIVPNATAQPSTGMDLDVDSHLLWESDLIGRAEVFRAELDHTRQVAADGQRTIDLSTAETALKMFEDALNVDEPVSIALLGGTGAGKSTLLNAIIGERVVPTSSMKACTSVITRVGYRDEESYRAEIEFVTRESWSKQLAAASHDVLGAAAPDVDDVSGVAEQGTIPRDEEDRLLAVYGPECLDEFRRTGDVEWLIAPDDVSAALDLGRIVIEEADIAAFRDEVKKYLDSNGYFWPIVRTVRIEGRFNALRGGGEIVDLPGLNDPNEAREETTRHYLRSARFVWVVFNTKRSLTKDITQTLHSRDLLGQLLAGGRLSTLTFVGTATDQIDPESDCEQLGLDPEAPEAEIVAARNAETAKVVRGQLEVLADDLVRSSADFDQDDCQRIAKALVGSPIYAVSARDYLVLNGIQRGRSVLDTDEATVIPQLREHFHRISIEAGPLERAYRARQELEIGLNHLEQVINAARVEEELAAESQQAGREEIAAGIEKANNELAARNAGIIKRLKGCLQQTSAEFEASLKGQSGSTIIELGNIVDRWAGMHWATLKATAARNGRFNSSGCGAVDLVDAVAKPIVNRATGPWTKTYDAIIPKLVNDAQSDILESIEQYKVDLLGLLDADAELRSALRNRLAAFGRDMSKVTMLELDKFRSGLVAAQRRERGELHEIIETRLLRALQTTFAACARERGEGMKLRMIRRLREGVLEAANAEFDKIVNQLSAVIRTSASAVEKELSPLADRIDNRAAGLLESCREAVTVEPADFSWLEASSRRLAEVREHVVAPLPS